MLKTLTLLVALLAAGLSCRAQDAQRLIFDGVSAAAASASASIDAGASTRSVSMFVSYNGIKGAPQGCHVAVRGGVDRRSQRLLRPANLDLREPDGQEVFLLNLRARHLVFQYSCLNEYPSAGKLSLTVITSDHPVEEPPVVNLFRTDEAPHGNSAGYGSFLYDPYYPFVGLTLLANASGRITIDQVSSRDSISQPKTIIDLPVQEPTTPAPGMGLHPVNLWCIPVYPEAAPGAQNAPFGLFTSQWQKTLGTRDPSRFELAIVGLSAEMCSRNVPRQARIAFSRSSLPAHTAFTGPVMRQGSGLFDEVFYLVTTDQPGTIKIVQWTGDLTAERTTDSIAIPAGTSSGVLSIRGSGLRCEILNGATAQTSLDFSCWVRKR